MRIHIVTHCWAGQSDIYATLLRFHLSSLLKVVCPAFELRVTICAAKCDDATMNVLDQFFPWFAACPGKTLVAYYMPTERLFRRAIGRNEVLKLSNTAVAWDTNCDAVWVTDCDVVFKGRVFIRLIRGIKRGLAPLNYPNQFWQSETIKEGEKTIARGRAQPLNQLVGLGKDDRFVIKPLTKAIGAFQIIDGAEARKGYCDGDERIEESPERWQRCTFDVAYRKGKEISGLDLPDIYRIRHTPTVIMRSQKRR